ncbi:formyltetrahydrofolate deformylase [Rhodospirillum rubrum]|uniref:Formyltetrahydrofolate deformylase n=2 Tax=Rhodospirillum rubrum TaxID=1085 RepID=Q2RWY5_RHORT|nr:formyltetrahydrofolate deformylase [Rhodospirillum rubrum]ABC21360.1 formyltetrahydrofolate deformylase [Rhodospirillum rubrum ATCC 11170]AEO47040.1 formyltetrahydrofolate deformylase [Rhodospirillum rubrum F11]MBK5952946.1 formyltetrahydrofolate deformylase [Rhodospirillum rubrum]QXG81038.1 formyltetrahydrofolate deformylase [Rhodospirillum rubrum]HAQ01518.1 formyltetrahydrofolate deformylase [Rhodospirillum rubrum]
MLQPQTPPPPTDPRKAIILTITCPDGFGLVAAVSGFLNSQGAFIIEAAYYSDPDTGRFFMRTVFRSDTAGLPSLGALRECFAPVAERFEMTWDLVSAERKPKVVIAVSRFGHCLYDLLHRWQAGQLHVEIPAIVSNHKDLARLAEWHGIPFHHLPVTTGGKEAQEEAILKVIDDSSADLVVLARYMQILSPAMSSALSGRCINIHHSFLPSFKGAKPYHQAHARGVKIIGATAHYVTDALDEGPIIEQEVARVDHKYRVDDLVAAGRDLETVVLARAVRWHVERRVMINGTKTVVLR